MGKRMLCEVFEDIQRATQYQYSLLQVIMGTEIVGIEGHNNRGERGLAAAAYFWDTSVWPSVLLGSIGLSGDDWDLGQPPAPRLADLELVVSFTPTLDIEAASQLFAKKGLWVEIEHSDKGDYVDIAIVFGKNLVQHKARIRNNSCVEASYMIYQTLSNYCKERATLTIKEDFPIRREEALQKARGGAIIDHKTWSEEVNGVELTRDFMGAEILIERRGVGRVLVDRVMYCDIYKDGWRVVEEKEVQNE